MLTFVGFKVLQVYKLQGLNNSMKKKETGPNVFQFFVFFGHFFANF